MSATISTFNRRILIVDDNESLHQDFYKILQGGEIDSEFLAIRAALFSDGPVSNVRQQRFDLDSAYQGQDGLALVRQSMSENRPYAMAFVDMRMPPGWDGVETIEQLWKVDSDLEVVICTAYSDHDWDKVTHRLGQHEKLLILRKPFDSIKVRQLAESLTHKWNLARQAQQHLLVLKEAEKAIRINLNETVSIVNAISAFLIGLNEENQVIWWNTSAECALGYAKDSTMGQPLEALDIPWDWPQILSSISCCRATMQAVHLPEVHFARPGQHEAFLELTVSPILGEAGKASGLLILGSEITKRKTLESQLVIAQKMESIGQLAAGVAHELNTPIHYVAENVRFLRDNFEEVQPLLTSYIDLLQAYRATGGNPESIDAFEQILNGMELDYLVEEIPNVIRQTLEGTSRVSQIVQAMKELSHPGTEKKVLLDIRKAVTSTIIVATKEWKDVAEVTTEFDPNLPQIPCHASELNQVLLNLLVNAAQAIRENGRRGKITISTHLDGKWAEIRIADTGPGVPDSIRSKIFDPFFTTKEVGKGTGQGLALAHFIVVQKHGGSITFETEVGKGTTFILRLPFDESYPNTQPVVTTLSLQEDALHA